MTEQTVPPLHPTLEINIIPPCHLTVNEQFLERIETYCKLPHANKLFVRNLISANGKGNILKLVFSTQGTEVNSNLSADLLKVSFEVMKEIEFPNKSITSKIINRYELCKENGRRFLKMVRKVID